MASAPAVGFQGRPFLCLSVPRNIVDPGARRGSLGWWSFQDDLKMPSARLLQEQPGRGCPLWLLLFPYPCPLKCPALPKLPWATVPSVFCPFCLSLARKSIVSGTHTSFLLPASVQLVTLMLLQAFLPGKCQEGGA